MLLGISKRLTQNAEIGREYILLFVEDMRMECVKAAINHVAKVMFKIAHYQINLKRFNLSLKFKNLPMDVVPLIFRRNFIPQQLFDRFKFCNFCRLDLHSYTWI